MYRRLRIINPLGERVTGRVLDKLYNKGLCHKLPIPTSIPAVEGRFFFTELGWGTFGKYLYEYAEANSTLTIQYIETSEVEHEVDYADEYQVVLLPPDTEERESYLIYHDKQWWMDNCFSID